MMPSPVHPAFRLVTALLAAAFLFVGIATTVRSLGTYCLTSDGGNTARLPE